MKSRFHSLRRLAGLSLITILLSVSALSAQLAFHPTPPDFQFSRLVASFPQLAQLGKFARENRASVGLYGGTVRDLFLGHPFTPISDIDLIFDSSEEGFPPFRNAVLDFSRTGMKPLPAPDFHFDMAQGRGANERLRQFHEEGITATKVGVMSNDRLLDPTGWGVSDLRNRVFRYWPPDRSFIEPHNLGRFLRDRIRLPEFSIASSTDALLKKSVERCLDRKTPTGRSFARAARNARSRAGKNRLVTFANLLDDFRNDVRRLHDWELKKLSKSFPFDIFFFDILKSVTQCADLADLRRELGNYQVDKLLASVGFGSESDVLMKEGFSKEDIFRLLEFPGFRNDVQLQENFLETWEGTLRRFNYRILFDMLRSEFPAESYERVVLQRRRDDFLNPRSYAVLNPGDDFGETLAGFLDTEFNMKVLPREKVMKSLEWFLANYLPLGKCTLLPLKTPRSRKPPRVGQIAATEGYPPEVSAIDRLEPHSLVNLDEYLAIQIGTETIPLYLDRRTGVAFLMTDREGAAKFLEDHGYAEVFLVNAAGFQRRRGVLLGFDAARNRVCIAEYGFHTDDQLLNHQARFYFLKRGMGPLIDRNTWIARAPENAPLPDDAAFQAFLHKLGRPVDVFFLGFSTPLKKILKDPRFHRLGDLEIKTGFIERKGKGKPLFALSLSGFGASYGSLSALLASRMIPHGLKTVVLLGTGGGLLGVKRRFQWVAPDRVFLAGSKVDADSPTLGFVNLARNITFKDGVTESLHATVITPLVETQSRIREMRAKGAMSVDCELYHLVKAVRDSGQPVGIFALLNITDFPLGSEEERSGAGGGITLENSLDQHRFVEEAMVRVVNSLE